MRLFVAINFPESVRLAIWEGTRAVRDATGAIRWVAPEQFHLTLKFLGECDDGLVPSLADMLLDIAGRHRELALTISEIGAFPNLWRPRVVWTGMRGGDAVVALAGDVERGCAALGFAVERRPFHPHLTLGRAKRDLSYAERGALERAAALVQNRHVKCTIGSVELMRSTLSGAGAQYTVLTSAVLLGG